MVEIMIIRHNLANLSKNSISIIQDNNSAPIAKTVQPKTIFPDTDSDQTIIDATINNTTMKNIFYHQKNHYFH